MLIDDITGRAIVCDNKLQCIAEIWDAWESVETPKGLLHVPTGERFQVHFFDDVRGFWRVINFFSTKNVESVLITAKNMWPDSAADMYTTQHTDFPTFRKAKETAKAADYYHDILGREHF